MEELLYNSSFTLYALPLPTPVRLLNLLSASPSTLATHATNLQTHLTSHRPAYEAEEEREKFGSLRTCTITPLTTSGLEFSIIYDRTTYKFIVYTSSDTKTSPASASLPLVLAKANASLTKRFFSFLATTYHLSDPTSLKLSSHLLLFTTQTYISALHHSLEPLTENHSILSLLRDIIGSLKITISVNDASSKAQLIKPHLRTIDLDVTSETLYQLLQNSVPRRPSERSKKHDDPLPPITFLAELKNLVRERTGLKLPITPEEPKQPLADNVNGATIDEPVLRVTRIQSTAFAISVEGRLKLSNKPVDMMDVVPGLTGGDENVVKLANKGLLEAIVKEAERIGAGD